MVSDSHASWKQGLGQGQGREREGSRKIDYPPTGDRQSQFSATEGGDVEYIQHLRIQSINAANLFLYREDLSSVIKERGTDGPNRSNAYLHPLLARRGPGRRTQSGPSLVSLLSMDL